MYVMFTCRMKIMIHPSAIRRFSISLQGNHQCKPNSMRELLGRANQYSLHRTQESHYHLVDFLRERRLDLFSLHRPCFLPMCMVARYQQNGARAQGVVSGTIYTVLVTAARLVIPFSRTAANRQYGIIQCRYHTLT
jgi:hypothetical protein